MYNRKHHRWLLPLVLLIWIWVGFRFWFREEPSTRQTQETQVNPKEYRIPLNDPEPFALSLPYRDPFLSSGHISGNAVTVGAKKQKAEVHSPPALKYLGSVHSVKQAVGLLRWESGKVTSVQAGLQFHALTILKVEPERLVFRYRKKVYQLKRLGS